MHPELILASYIENLTEFTNYNTNSNTKYNQNPDGCVFVWNTKFSTDQDKQESIFHFQSPITSACFADFHPNLIIGGTYSGRIVMWDNRTGKLMPVQRSNVSTSCHTHPVFCTKIVGTQNSHNLISLSSDGRLCTWSLDMLSQPSETIDLAHKKARCISATSMSFISHDINHCIIGSEEGNLYTVQRLSNKAGIVDVYDAHFGPVTSVHCHPGDSNLNEFSHLFLSSSMDWTVKLWSTKLNQPLITFEDYSDYLCDVCWSPITPSIFACVDSQGTLDVWDINKSCESPIVSINSSTETPLTKVSWSSNGNFIATGGENGHIEIYNADRLYQDSQNNAKLFLSNINNLKTKSTSTFNSNSNFYSKSNLKINSVVSQ